MDALTAEDLQGLWVPIITPFRTDGTVDGDGLARLAVRLLDDGAAGLVALGTTGEPATLTPAERRTVAGICASAAMASGRRLVVGAGSNDTRATMAGIEAIADSGSAGAVMVVVPYYSRPSPAAVVEHFRLVADASPLPVVAYNVPHRTGVELPADAIGAIADHPNVIGLKQAVGCVDLDTLQLLAEPRSDFAVLAGDDTFIAPTILLGGAGASPPRPTCAPRCSSPCPPPPAPATWRGPAPWPPPCSRWCEPATPSPTPRCGRVPWRAGARSTTPASGDP